MRGLMSLLTLAGVSHPITGALPVSKHCVVIGANNSAHDICADLWEWGALVTMIQRSPSIVVRSQALMKFAWGPLYSEAAVKAGITTEEDGSGIHTTYLRRGSGYYIDVGASQLIIDGEIKLESGCEVERINARSLTLSNGKDIPADLIVFATGYGSMNGWAAMLISQEVADKVGKCWGLGSDTRHDPGPWEGELRNMWKPTQQAGLWFHGGNLMQSRHYSRYLALQLKARMENVPTPVYGIPPVHHKE
jgi:putative flavoprotein involved in K+ transport